MGTVHFNVAKLVKAVEVRGDSMSPNYNDGDWLLFRLLPAKSNPAKPKSISSANALAGKVVLIQRNSQVGTDFLQVKRVTQITNDSKFNNAIGIWVEGDNKDKSTDSRTWGAIDSSEVIGKLIFRYRRAR
jgi:signal peptidase I